MSETIVLMHGFGGGPSSFQEFQQFFRRQSPTSRVLTPDFYSSDFFHPKLDLNQWQRDFKEYISQSVEPEQTPWLVGYSMGGRLAMHALVNQPEKFRGAVFFSASPGLQTSHERASRRKWDQGWAEKIRSLDSLELNRLWNAQEVFKGSELVSLREDIAREVLAENLCQWSPAKHLFTWDQLKELPHTCLWVSGSQDEKYCSIYHQMQQSGFSGEWNVVPEAGHRLLVTHGEGITKIVYDFIQTRGG